MKPLQKVVTASDIQNCLYYVHVDSVDDKYFEEDLQDEHQRDRHGDDTDISSGSTNGFHKPLQQEPDSYINKRPALPSRIHPHQPPTQNSNSSMQVKRKPVGQNSTLGTTIIDSPSKPSPPTLLGPRPMHQHAYSEQKEVLEIRPERRNVDMRRWSEHSTAKLPQPPPRPKRESMETPYLPPRPITRTLDGVEEGEGSSHQQRYSGPRKSLQVNNLEHSQTELEVSLTLIRRHDSLQQNVGKISRTSRSACLSTPTNTDYGQFFEETQGGTSIEILTPGYAKFAGDSIDFEKTSRSDELQSRPRNSNNNGDQMYFRRQLQVANYKKPPNQKQRPNSDSTSSKHGFSSKFKIHRHSQDTSDEKAERKLHPNRTHQSIDPKGYMFQSPWNGTCEFHTGIAGRSLKCKHTLPSPNTQLRSAPVSELRFNLPSSKTLAASPLRSNPRGHPDASKPSHLPSNHHARHSSRGGFDAHGYKSPSESEEADDERLDLSLGQERAGGGFGGKEAKLGKLIVESEGLMMLDLVVAANVGLWWGVYERGI